MKLLYTSDLHGDANHYTRLIAAAESVRPKVVILGGDLLPDESVSDPAKIGFGQPQFIRQQFRTTITDLRRAGRCDHVLVIFGNHDWSSAVPAMQELATEGLLTILDHKRGHEVSGLNFVGYSCTPPTPWFVKDFERLDKPGDVPPLLGGARWDARFSRILQHSAPHIYSTTPSIAEELKNLVVPANPWVFVAHAPPKNTKLDQAFGNHHYGSLAIREAIEQHQPLLSLHGHIHESPVVSGQFQDQLEKTVAVNPGQTQRGLSYVVIDIDIPASKIASMSHGLQQ